MEFESYSAHFLMKVLMSLRSLHRVQVILAFVLSSKPLVRIERFALDWLDIYSFGSIREALHALIDFDLSLSTADHLS